MTQNQGGPPRAVVLLSGGLDSSTVLAIAKDGGYEVHALSFAYGQRHAVPELGSAKLISSRYGVVDHRVAHIDLALFGCSALTADIAVPKDEVGAAGVPVTYVPARNTIFLSYALAFAEVVGADDIFIGVNALDYSGYPDCRPEYIDAFQRLARLATRAGVEGSPVSIRTPLSHMTKADIVRAGLRLDVPYELTFSCYDPQGEDHLACGHCDACALRLKGFAEAGVTDPIEYADRP